MTILTAALLGLVFGSFGTVAAWRIPRRETIVKGRSMCPECGRQLTWYENIPVASWLLQGGRCRGCGSKISVRYPLTEIITAALFVLAVTRFDHLVESLVFAAFFWTLVVLSAIDLEHKLLPNRVVYPTFVVGWAGLVVCALAVGEADRLVDAVLGTAVFGGFFFLVAFVFPAGMGGGDVKLSFSLGAFLGYAGGIGVVLAGMFLSFLLGGIVGIVFMLVGGRGRKSQVPFGPFLAAGTVIGIGWGSEMVDAYLGYL